jgi:hypothetical protein
MMRKSVLNIDHEDHLICWVDMLFEIDSTVSYIDEVFCIIFCAKTP